MQIRTSFAAALRNLMSQVGTGMALVSGVLIVILVALDLFGFEPNPYVGIITYVLLPTTFALGLVLITWGVIRERKRAPEARFPVIDLNNPRTRRAMVRFVVIVCVCVVILATATAGGIHAMESNAFCGTVCHDVMSPEYTAFQHSPHASIHCVDCHVAPGAGGFVKAKVQGAWQLVSVAFDLYEQPIPTPVHTLPSTELTCAECHWTGKYHGVKPKVITRFASDEQNTETKTILLMNVGGNNYGEALGIHWHTDPDVTIRYRADESLQTIHEVELTLPDGTVKTYEARNGIPDDGHTEWHTMDCVDCHNRPAHSFRTATAAIDLAMQRGFIANDLPYIRREAARAVRAGYVSHEQAREQIPAVLGSFYESTYAQVAAERRADIDEAARVLVDMYETNVFPQMRVDWGSYPSFLGHTDTSPGCFRCHAGEHATAGGEVITVDCRACHTIVAWDEASPQILEMLRRGEGR